jgi:tripartite-type tricarboxylate transporter receptor subunit TctC
VVSVRGLLLLLVAVAAALPGAARAAAAAEYPTRPVRFVVSYPPGGPADILARLLAQRLSVRLGEQVVVDNRPGANGNIGAQLAARAQPDGHTIFMLTSSHAANMTLYRQPGYDVARDFAPVTNVASYPLLLVVQPSVGARSVRDLVALAKTDPGRLTFASGGSGGGAHLAAELFNSMAGIRMTHVPYQGTGPGLAGVLGGQVSLMFAGVSAALPHVNDGRLVALGISSRERLPAAPGVPTVSEAGMPGYEVASWLGVAAPAGTPAAAVSRLNRDIVAITEESDFRSRLAADGAAVEATSPEAFGAYILAEIAKWADVIRASGARID